MIKFCSNAAAPVKSRQPTIRLSAGIVMPTPDKFSLTGYQNCEYPVNEIQHIQCAQALPYEENANLPEGLLVLEYGD